MKVGLSIYSLYQAIISGGMTELEAIDTVADMGADHIELVGFVTPFAEKPSLLKDVKQRCKERNLPISAYCTGIDALSNDLAVYEAQLQKAFSEIDIAEQLGASAVRSDLTQWGRPSEANVIECFDRDLPRLIDACGRMADYAESKGITMTVENHGTFVNGSERIRRLILGVGRANFRCTLDIGNGLCVDEDPLVCVKNLLPFAETVHFKDFLIRKDGTACGGKGPAKFAVASWLTTDHGNFLRGTIVGDGDVDVVGIMQYMKSYGFDGIVSIEFEGPEECIAASRISLDNVKRYINL